MALSNRYLLTERIAAGGMGEVWAGTDVLLKRQVAVKVLLPMLMSDSEFITRFRTEARMMAALKHPGIVQIYDYGEDVAVNGSHLDYLVMEYVDGTPLAQRIQAAGRLGAAETASIVAQAAAALQVAHDAGIVHRDVKPSNLLVRPDGVVVLVDFGVARSTGITGITSTNIVLGSAHFMAPEQAAGKPISPATDIYALGAVAYCCLAGRPPFVGDHPLSVLAQLVQEEPAPLPADVPAAVSSMVLRALDKRPANRYASAAAFANAARATQGAAPSASAPPAPGGGSARYLTGRSGPFRPAPPPAAERSGDHVPTFAPAAERSGGPVPTFASAGGPVPTFAPAGGPVPAFASAGGPVPMLASPADRSTGHGPMRPPVPAGSRRRNTTLAVAAVAAIVAGLIGVVFSLTFRPGLSEAQTTGGNAPGPGGPGGQSTGKGRGALPGPTRSKTQAGRTGDGGGAATAPVAVGGTDPTASAAAAGTATGTTTNPYSPRQVCGNAFQIIDEAPLRGADGSLAGRVFLLFNAANGKNCTVTLKAVSVGVATPASAYLEVQGATRLTDSGAFQYYAGPVKAAAANQCVKWGGSVGGATFDSPFEHCG